jgi:DNA-binding NarL/FixJ family response regulator
LSLAEELAWQLAHDNDKPLHQILSDREYEVLCLLASGKTVKEIARGLCLGEKTIGTYRTRVLKKMGMKNVVELTHYAIENRLID